MENELQFIREVCIKANPEKYLHVFEDGFALCKRCSVARQWRERIPHLETQIVDEKSGGSSMEVTMRDHNEIGQVCYKSDMVIRLADVLLAFKVDGTLAQVDTNGQINFSPFKGDCIWDLKQDDFTLQSKETIEFIYELLK